MALEYKDDETKKQAELKQEIDEKNSKYKKYTIDELLTLLKENNILCGKQNDIILKWNSDNNTMETRQTDSSWQESFLSFNDFINDEYMLVENPIKNIESFWRTKGWGEFKNLNILDKTLTYASTQGYMTIHLTEKGFYITGDISFSNADELNGSVEYFSDDFDLEVIQSLKNLFDNYNKLNA